MSGGSSSHSPAVRDPSRTLSTYNIRASVHRYMRLVHISDSTTKNGVNQEARFPKKNRSTPKHTGQTVLENWQRKSDARSCYDCLLPGHVAADCTTDKRQAAALRVILEWLATTHASVLPKLGARSAVRAWYRTNGVNFGRHNANVLSLMTTAVNKTGLAVPKAERPAVKRAVGRKTNPVNAVFSDNDFTLESSSSSSCYIDFSFNSRRGKHRVCRSAEDLRRHPSLSPFNARSGQSTRAGWGRMVEERVQAATFSLWLGSNQGSHVVDH
jgi:hypothetical protein